MRGVIYLLLSLIFLSSCVSKKSITYFQNDKIDLSKASNSFKTVFKPDDLLEITILSENIESVKPFNLPAATFSAATNLVAGNPQQQRYLINKNGEIDFPLIGKLKLGGLTREEAIKLLNIKLNPDYVKDPTINIRIANFKVTVLGDVQKPGTYTIPSERITILEAIGLAGDLNISGQRNGILVTREEGDEKKFYRVDLLSNKIFTSPVYYLQQNDVVYIDQNKAKAQSAATNQNTGLFVSIGSILISLIAVLTR
ncbi:polysaccharide biosynthesis/export family protein [Pseudotenacibaculum sp. MALMAid0570]|uniref:polysaccharide biosynthesis/export family protein n=1 Tax=Pseudotenacibaculum sp. MALMAid0570 TaxID=3143938 RepID=UPI0032DE561D